MPRSRAASVLVVILGASALVQSREGVAAALVGATPLGRSQAVALEAALERRQPASCSRRRPSAH
jgi:hypothetical protein